jgi:hypothetical protein
MQKSKNCKKTEFDFDMHFVFQRCLLERSFWDRILILPWVKLEPKTSRFVYQCYDFLKLSSPYIMDFQNNQLRYKIKENVIQFVVYTFFVKLSFHY